MKVAATTGRVVGWLTEEQTLRAVKDGGPLEPAIQAESFSPDLASRLEIGKLFEQLLNEADLLALTPDFRDAYSLASASDDEIARAPDRETVRFRQVIAHRGLDGIALRIW